MKKHKHHHHDFDTALERIETKIQRIETNKPVRISDLTGANCDREITQATVMLLKKYGITYQE